MLNAVDEGISELEARNSGNSLAAWSNALEHDGLSACEGVIQEGTFEEGDIMLILPGGGHAILTGDTGKVVLAGEWHLRTDIWTLDS